MNCYCSLRKHTVTYKIQGISRFQYFWHVNPPPKKNSEL